MRAILFRIPVIALLLAVLAFPTWSPARADEMTCPEHTFSIVILCPNRIRIERKKLNSTNLFGYPVNGRSDVRP